MRQAGGDGGVGGWLLHFYQKLKITFMTICHDKQAQLGMSWQSNMAAYSL